MKETETKKREHGKSVKSAAKWEIWRVAKCWTFAARADELVAVVTDTAADSRVTALLTRHPSTLVLGQINHARLLHLCTAPSATHRRCNKRFFLRFL